MNREYRTVQPSKYEGKIPREAAASVFRAIAEGKIKLVRERHPTSGKESREARKRE